MITLTCSKCQTKLEVDDAFGGGVCRCRNCGAIQHVPASGKKAKSNPKSSGKATAKRRDSGRGLSDTSLGTLADLAATAGLAPDEPSPERLPQPGAYPPPKPTPDARSASRRSFWIAIAIGAVIVVGAAVWLMMSGRNADRVEAAPPVAEAAADR